MQALLRARSNARPDTRCNKKDLAFEHFNRKGAFLVIEKCTFVSGSLGHTRAKRSLTVLQQDYLLRMFLQIATAIRESLQRSRGEQDPEAAASLLDQSLEDATEIDGSLLLCMAPETMAAMLQLSQSDPLLMEYVARTVLLSSKYLYDAGEDERASLRKEQAFAVAHAFGIELSEESIKPEELEQFFETTQN